MRIIAFIVFMTVIAMTCQSHLRGGSQRIKEGKTKSSKASGSPSKIYVKDSADYSIAFLQGLQNSGLNEIQLIDSMCIIGGVDTVFFSQYPEMQSPTILTGRKDNLAVALTVKRVNQTTIDYKLEMVEFGKANYSQKGQASISPSFYLGAKIDESSLSGIAYEVDEYQEINKFCFTYIRLGKEESRPYLLGKLIKNCNGELRGFSIDDFPTLVEK